MCASLLFIATLAALGQAEPVLTVTDRAVVTELQASGLDLATRLGAAPGASNAVMDAQTGWRVITRVIARDLREIARRDSRAGTGMGYSHRLFDSRWLRSEDARFDLVGVVNRLDRHPFHPDACGEVRLVYRLAYRGSGRTDAVESRLPMTVNLVFWQPGQGGEAPCAGVARRWFVPASLSREDPRGFVPWLRSDGGPLSEPRLSTDNLKSLEVNIQSVRWPSTVHPTLGGHAEYILRVFRYTAEGFRTARLENTPDVGKLRRSAHLRRRLLSWLGDPVNLDQIDRGVAVLPEEFLATRSVSVTPRGLARRANRPFRQLFSPDTLADLPLSGRTHIGSPVALLRRLDGRTCAGCHESRSVAGFHLLGEDQASMDVDALAVARSPHLVADQPRRRAYLEAWARGQTPDGGRGVAERLEREGGYGSHCGLGDPGLAHWTCAQGLRCRPVDEPEVGMCLPGSPEVGDPCQVGDLKTADEGHRDRVRNTRAWPCGEGQICETNRVGFPGGMCAATCDDLGPEGACGSIALLTPFNRCLARGRPFPICVRDNVRPAGLRRCDDDAPCRDDYVCTRTSQGDGTCLPPYFLFQLRVDGH